MDAREKLNEFAELRGLKKNKLIGWSEAADFGEWLVKTNAKLQPVGKRCSHCLYRKYRPNARYGYETNQCQISGHNLTDVENHSCEHYKPIPNVF